MVIGNGLIARAFLLQQHRLPHTCVFASGVSNSGCEDGAQFERERQALRQAISAAAATNARVLYFSTCSVEDPEVRASPYVRHKLQMEALVRLRSDHLILRLPQVAGCTPNPHTLLNYLCEHIVGGERFMLWGNALRNIIDVDDVARIVVDLVQVENASGETANIANTRNIRVLDIVRGLETALGRKAQFDIVDRGGSYLIDTQRIHESLRRCDIKFGENYLGNLINKYYRTHVANPA